MERRLPAGATTASRPSPTVGKCRTHHSRASEPAATGHVHPGGEWNSARLVANGNHVEQWLNGFKMVEFELGSRDWDSKVAGSKFKPHLRFGKNTQGHIGLQDHGNVVAFRNIKIRVLP